MAKADSSLAEADEKVASLLRVSHDKSRSDAERSQALSDLPLVIYQARAATIRRAARAVVEMISSPRIALRVRALWCAYQFVELAENGWLKIPIARADVDRAVLRAKEIGLKRGTLKHIRSYQRSRGYKTPI